MSLFQVRQWWEIRCDQKEEFDQDHLIVGNIDNDPSNTDKIMTASLEGIIRMYSPTDTEYKVEHLILELDLKQSILQIALGQFLSNDKHNFLAVLHSRQLCVYAVTAIGGYGTKAQYYELTKKYHHDLDRNAFNFVCGRFGQRQPSSQHEDQDTFSDSICVQSLDGKFWVFQQEHSSFSRDWNNFLIPGCIAYAPFNDCIIITTAEMKLYSYSFAVLSTSEQQKLTHFTLDNEHKTNTKSDSSERKSSKSLHKNWCINLCEHAVRIICARFTSYTTSPSDHDIIVLCERSIFAISTNGVIHWQKKLDYNPSTIVAYKAQQTDAGYMENIIVANFQNAISIYSNCALIWSARMSFSPIDIRIGSFGGINGMQVMLSDEGHLMIGYLGTDPSGYQPVHVDKGEIDWENMEQHMKESKDIIRQLEDNEMQEASDFIELRIGTLRKTQWIENDYIIADKYGDELVSDSMGRFKAFKTKLKVEYRGDSNYGVSDIQITIDNDKAFVCNQNNLRIKTMNAAANTQEFELIFYCRKTMIPNSLECNIYAVYLNEDDKMQSDQLSFEFPFTLLLHAAAPIKNTKYSFTLEVTNINPPSPTELFIDILGNKHAEILRTPQVLTLVFYCNNYDVTMLLSRKGGRIRIQSGELDAVWIVIHELRQRLYKVAKTQNKEDVQISLKDELPLNEYLEHITKRYIIVQEMRMFETNLDKLADQFRVIQKRLLTRYKNKNPTPLNQMDVLLKQTYQNIIQNTNKVQQLTEKCLHLSDTLWNLTRLIWILMELKNGLDEENVRMLKAFLPIGTTEIEEGWEEQLEAAMVYALRTCLAKSKKDTKISEHTLGKIKDIQKVTRHIKIVCDRIGKGQRFTDKPQFT